LSGNYTYRVVDSAYFPIKSASGDFSHEAVIIQACSAFIKKRLRHVKFMREKLLLLGMKLRQVSSGRRLGHAIFSLADNQDALMWRIMGSCSEKRAHPKPQILACAMQGPILLFL